MNRRDRFWFRLWSWRDSFYYWRTGDRRFTATELELMPLTDEEVERIVREDRMSND